MRAKEFARGAILGFIAAAPIAMPAWAIDYKTINVSASNNAADVSGNQILGNEGVTFQGYVYNGSTVTLLPGPPGGSVPIFTSISGNNVVGVYSPTADGNGINGFLYDGSSYHSLNYPNALSTTPYGIDSKNVVGQYLDSSIKLHGFLYDGSSYKTIDDPTSSGTVLLGISGNKIIGGSNARSFIYDGSTFKTQTPLKAADGFTFAPSPTGIDGDSFVGSFADAQGKNHGYWFDGTTVTVLDDPLAGPIGTIANGIDGNTIVGTYFDGNGNGQSFMVTVPEPTTAALLGFGSALAARRNHRYLRSSS